MRKLVIAAGAAVAALASVPSVTASAATHSRLGVVQDYEATVFTRANPALGQYFFGPGSYETADKVATPATTPMRWFASLAAFRSAHTPRGSWAFLDLESWGQTPRAESSHPVATMRAFGALAAARGVKWVAAPALDLGLVDSECPKGGSKNYQWYVKCGIARAAAAAGAKILITQTQSQQPTPAIFASLYHAAVGQVAGRAAVFTQISQQRDGADTARAVADVRAVHPAGVLLRCPRGSLAWERTVLAGLRSAGF